MGSSTKEFEKALESLKEALNLYKHAAKNSHEQKAFRDACIQRFKYCIELSWKLSIKIMGSNTSAAKPAIREMARNNMISDPNLWIGFIEARNNTSHPYDENVALKVFQEIEAFYPEAMKLLTLLSKADT